MSDRSLVLVVSNDFSPAAAKTSRHLCQALDRLGLVAIGRDTRLPRWAARQLEHENPVRREDCEEAVTAKWSQLVADYGVGTVISLDLHWLFSARLFVADGHIKRIHSFWSDDVRSQLQDVPRFSLAPRTPLELINEAKVSHHCPGRGQAEELRLLGVQSVFPSALAAPAELLRADEPCLEPKRIAFLGNPGLAAPPSPAALAAMDRGENTASLRRLARQEIIKALPATELTAQWLRQSPGVETLLAAATELRLTRPHAAAVSLLVEAGAAYPDAFDFLKRGGLLLDAATIVKFVSRYDRAALVRKLWRRGWLDVYGAPEPWAPYGITTKSPVPFPRLASVYRRYPAILNAPNCTRETAANEKLFEIAACARVSLNMDSLDLRACYSEDEIILAASDEALEAVAEQIVRDSTAALDQGEKARVCTAAGHLWEHRLKKALV